MLVLCKNTFKTRNDFHIYIRNSKNIPVGNLEILAIDINIYKENFSVYIPGYTKSLYISVQMIQQCGHDLLYSQLKDLTTYHVVSTDFHKLTNLIRDFKIKQTLD